MAIQDTDKLAFQLEELDAFNIKNIDEGVAPFERRVIHTLQTGEKGWLTVGENEFSPLYRLLVYSLIQRISPRYLVLNIEVGPEDIVFKNDTVSAFALGKIFHPLLGVVQINSQIGNAAQKGQLEMKMLALERRAQKKHWIDANYELFMRLDFQGRAMEQLKDINKFVLSVMKPRLQIMHGYRGNLQHLGVNMNISQSVLRFQPFQR